jgi:hypothetical protein
MRLPYAVSVSMITPMFGSSARMRNTELPPMPSSGFRTMSPCSARKARITSSLRVTTVGAVNCGKRAMASFSLKSRRLRGRFQTFAPCASASSRRYVL